MEEAGNRNKKEGNKENYSEEKGEETEGEIN